MTWVQKANFLFSAVMIIVFFGLAILFAFTNYGYDLMIPSWRSIFAGVLALYGSFRAYTLYRNYKRLKYDDSNEV